MKRKQITLILMVLLLNVCTKTWKEIPKYSKSLAYASFINAFYYYLFKRHLIWEFTPGGINWRHLRKIHIFIVTPLLVLLFLSRFPKTLFRRIVYLTKCIVTSSLVEHYIAKKGMIKFKYGWNMFWSAILYFQMYVFSYLFLKRPLLVWFLSVCSILFYMVKFKVPLTKRLIKGPYFLFCHKTNDPFKDKVKSVVYPYCVDFLNGLRHVNR